MALGVGWKKKKRKKEEASDGPNSSVCNSLSCAVPWWRHLSDVTVTHHGSWSRANALPILLLLLEFVVLAGAGSRFARFFCFWASEVSNPAWLGGADVFERVGFSSVTWTDDSFFFVFFYSIDEYEGDGNYYDTLAINIGP